MDIQNESVAGNFAFFMLKNVGKYINDSGSEEALIETELNEPTAMKQTKTGKHYKRYFEAILTIYLTLSSICKTNFF